MTRPIRVIRVNRPSRQPDGLPTEIIVVGIADLTAPGEKLTRAVVRARSGPVRLHLVHAYRDLAQVWLAQDALTAVEPLRRHSENRLAAIAAELEIEAGPIEYHARPGAPATVLASVAREQRADLIAIGAPQGRGSCWGAGGVMRRLARSCPCPVLVVPTMSGATARAV